MVNNKKYFAHMLSLALVVCTASVFVKGVEPVEVEEKKMKTFKRYRYYLNKGYVDKKWIAKKIRKDIDKDPERALEIIYALGVDPNMPVNNIHRQPYTLFGYTVNRVVWNADGLCFFKEDEKGRSFSAEKRCNVKLIEKLFKLGADLDKMSGWIFPSQSAREVVRDKSNDYSSFKRPKEGRICARAIERLFNGINELTDKEYADEREREVDAENEWEVDAEYKEYLKKQQEKKNKISSNSQ